MKQFSFLRRPLWLSLTIITGYAPAMTGPSAAYISSTTLIDYTKQPGAFSRVSSHFPRPVELTDAIHFWRQVFGDWRAHQIVLHDDTHLGVIYDMIEITGYIGGRLSAEQQAIVDQHKKRLIHQLNDLEYLLHKRTKLTTELQNLYTLITRKAGLKAIHDAAQRVRVQRGMKESFQTGLKASSQYNAKMREVFHEHSLPEELAHLPHVESAFTTTARSPAGAVGVWQFMPITGKRYLRIDKSMDERYDPILATHGSAKYLAYAYNKLGDWGLAVTSYNYGLSGMLRARQEHGKDIARIVKEYDGGSFGFASRNYYAEFLAVCDIMADLSRHFPENIDYQPPPSVKRIVITQEMTSGEIAKKYHVYYKKLAELNPSWTKGASEGRIALPANTVVWLPDIAQNEDPRLMASKDSQTADSKINQGNFDLSFGNNDTPIWNILEEFPDGLSGRLMAVSFKKQTPNIAQVIKSAKQKSIGGEKHEIHIVQTGDSPFTIASKYSVDLRELLILNKIEAGSLIRPGQSISIPFKINKIIGLSAARQDPAFQWEQVPFL